MRMIHVSYDKLDMMMRKKLVTGLPQLEVNKETIFVGCQYRKACQNPFEKSNFKVKKPLELIHSDVFGLTKQPLVKGIRYMITYIDDYSKFVWVYFMKEKAEVLQRFKDFKEKVERD